MKRLLILRLFSAAALCLPMTSLSLAQEPRAPLETTRADARLNRIIADYDALQRRIDPDAAARFNRTAPTRWPTVTRDFTLDAADDREIIQRRLKALTGLTGEVAVSRDILVALIEEDLIDARHDLGRIPFTGDWGFHMLPVFTAPRTRLTSSADAQAWIDRLYDTERYFSEHIVNMQRGIETGFTAHPDPLQTTIDQIAEQVAVSPTESPLYAPFLSLPNSIPAAERARLRSEGEVAVTAALAAYSDLLEFLEEDYAPNSRTGTGIGSLPGGKDAYADLIRSYTTRRDLTPEDVHRIGLERVASIRAEMEAILTEIGYQGSFEDFLTYLRTDPQFYAETPDELLGRAEEISARLRAILPDYFSRLPRSDFIVSPVPDSIAPGFTTARYIEGDTRASRPGTYLVNTFRLDQRPLYELPALSAHEAVPGHHLQIMIARELRGLPAFRTEYYATAFGEGWALYAEKVAGEAGIYQTPYEEFGALSYQMWRACRLVADTGIHWYGWTREEAEACFIENSALAPLNIRTEVTRYIGWPGQATAYMIGEITISDLRAEAEARLGDRFDIRAFHDMILGGGTMPLDVLERRARGWIAAQERAAEGLGP